MRGLRSFASVLGIAAVASSYAIPAFGRSNFADLGPIVIEARPRVHVQGKGGKVREPMRTVRDRARGRKDDPFFGIASNGRRGARERMLAMEAARATTTRGRIGSRNMGGKVKSNVFNARTTLGMARNAAFIAALNAGETHNGALKLARRVTLA